MSVKKKIFCFGSKEINKLPIGVKKLLDIYIDEEVIFLVGDCYGVDKAFQQYLSDKKYGGVFIYTSHNVEFENEAKPRNNIGNRECKIISTSYLTGTYEYWKAKDSFMIEECDEAIGVWNGKSKGTKNNIDALEKLKKKTHLYKESNS